MKRISIFLFALLLAGEMNLRAQGSADLTVKYMVSYDNASSRYTAWVVPNYDTPNGNNSQNEERGATAQFTLKVPQGFSLGEVRNIRGSWDQKPQKIGAEASYARLGADLGYEYYVIGKAPMETNFGTFRQGEPIALFSFSGRGGKPEDVQVLEANDPFVRLADDHFSLNVGNSFYSRSGQYRSVAATPFDQFSAPAVIKEVLTEMAEKAEVEFAPPGAEFNPEMQLIAYPNPVIARLKVHYFSLVEEESLSVELVDMEGRIHNKTNFVAGYGVNKLEMPVDQLITGVYVVRMKLGKTIVNRKILKVN